MLSPLYLGDALTPDTFEAGLMLAQIAKAIVGIAIAYIAYRGYRRNESRPMCYIALGFALVLGVPFVLYIGGVALVALVAVPTWAQAAVIGVAELSQLAGLVAILYALRL